MSSNACVCFRVILISFCSSCVWASIKLIVNHAISIKRVVIYFSDNHQLIYVASIDSTHADNPTSYITLVSLVCQNIR